MKELLFREQGALLLKVCANDSDLQVKLEHVWESSNISKIFRHTANDLQA